MHRRTFLLAGLGTVAGLWATHPRDRGRPLDGYFTAWNTLLRQQGPGVPTMLLDLDRLDQNIARIRASLPSGRPLRLVAKSLPSVELLGHILQDFPDQRLMVFHETQIQALGSAFPAADLLLGKPMPIEAVLRFYQTQPSLARALTPRINWLIDTPERARQYHDFAQGKGLALRTALEIDVGLHRGGFSQPEELRTLLPILSDSSCLQITGLMGYDAQVGQIPSFIESAATTLQHAQQQYRRMQEALWQIMPKLRDTPLIFNGAGSPTFRLHGLDSPLNEVAAGSAFVKASDFDLPALADLLPACWIASPVLKAWNDLDLPGPRLLSRLWSTWDTNRSRTYFIYGGGWRAHPVAPKGLSTNPLYGISTNQCMYNGSTRTALKVDDSVFLRPTQSEWVLQQFGSILAWSRQRAILQRWSVLPA